MPTNASPTAALVTNALEMAIDSSSGRPQRLGPRFTPARAFNSVAGLHRPRHGLWPSTGSFGDRYDKSMIESFWSRVQVEPLDRKKWKSRVELADAMFDFLKIWPNRRRRHSQLGLEHADCGKRIQESRLD